MPANFYNVEDLSSSVTVSDLGTGQVTIETSGWYEVAASSTNRDNLSAAPGTQSGIRDAGDHTQGWRSSPWVLYVDGSPIIGPIGSGVSTTVYLAAGQIIRPGIVASSPLAGAGSGGGSTPLYDQGYRTRSQISHVSGAPSASFTGRKVA